MTAAVLCVRADRRVVFAAAIHGAIVAALLSLAAGGSAAVRALAIAAIALGVCWGANTVAHIHLHRPLFRARAANLAFDLYLTVLLGIPQVHWRSRHLAHHAGAGGTASPLGLMGELLALGAGVAAMALWAPGALGVWGAAMVVGLALCWVQGREEHRDADPGVDHRGGVYNRLWFNDGYHAAHHRDPGAHWTQLPRLARPTDTLSALPPLLRWLAPIAARANLVQGAALDALERGALSSRLLRRLLLASHRPALARLTGLPAVARARTVVIVGGGLFPRSALLLGRLLPGARLVLLDRDARHLELAARCLDGPVRARTTFVVAEFSPERPPPCDLLVIPLGYRGDRRALYARPPAPAVLIHDWAWRRRGDAGARVSWWLLKRVNLVNLPSATAQWLPPIQPARPRRRTPSSASVAVTRAPS